MMDPEFYAYYLSHGFKAPMCDYITRRAVDAPIEECPAPAETFALHWLKSGALVASAQCKKHREYTQALIGPMLLYGTLEKEAEDASI